MFGPSFLKEKLCFEMNNNKIIVQTQQSSTQNKNHNLFINSTYSQINWSYHSSSDKLIQAISRQIGSSVKGERKQGATLT